MSRALGAGAFRSQTLWGMWQLLWEREAIRRGEQ